MYPAYAGALCVTRPPASFYSTVRAALAATAPWVGYVKDFSQPRQDVIASTLEALPTNQHKICGWRDEHAYETESWPMHTHKPGPDAAVSLV